MIYKTIDKQITEIKSEGHLNQLIYRDDMLFSDMFETNTRQLHVIKSIEPHSYYGGWINKEIKTRA